MKLILIGCEYAGTTTLAIAFHDYAREHLGIELGSIHDHWKIPYTVTHHPDRITEEEADLYLALTTRQKEAWQRHNLYYHTVAEQGSPADQIIVGFYIEDTIYADLYYHYGGPGEAGDRALHSGKIEERVTTLAPEVVLVHVKTRPEVIRQRMREQPHARPVVPEADVELVLDRFAAAFAASTIANKLELDTSNATVADTVRSLAAGLEPFLTDRDRARRAAVASEMSLIAPAETPQDLARRYKVVLRKQTLRRFVRMRSFYVLLSLSLGLLILFKYLPIYGALIAFKDFNVTKGILGSPWNDFAHFRRLTADPFFLRVVWNTFWLSVLRIAFAFPAPVILALLLNEVRSTAYKRTVQSISYLPHFMSWVVLGGIFREVLSPQRGIIGFLFDLVGLEPIPWLTNVPTFRGLLVVTGIWQGVGWGTIIFLAALSSVDPELYESAEIDGAGRFAKAVRITIPAMVPVIVILLLLQVSKVLDEGFDQIFNLYNPLVYSVADVIDTYIFRSGIVEGRYGYTAAVGLFRNVAGLIIVLGVNEAVRRRSEFGLW